MWRILNGGRKAALAHQDSNKRLNPHQAPPRHLPCRDQRGGLEPGKHAARRVVAPLQPAHLGARSGTWRLSANRFGDRPLNHNQALHFPDRNVGSGIAYILRRAQKKCGLSPDHANRITPHVLRHTTAMHLLQSGVDIVTIAAWLGHAQLATTHGYVEINLRMKQAVIATEAALPEISNGEYPSPDIVDWLDQLALKPSYVQSKGITSPKGGHKSGLLYITKCSG